MLFQVEIDNRDHLIQPLIIQMRKLSQRSNDLTKVTQQVNDRSRLEIRLFFSNFLLNTHSASGMRRNTEKGIKGVCSLCTLEKNSQPLRVIWDHDDYLFKELLLPATFIPGTWNSHCLIIRKPLLDKSHNCSTSFIPPERETQVSKG